jgi:hypothetical protein
MSSESQWRDDLATSTRQFQEIVWPQIKDWFGGDPELYPAEGKDDPLYRSFDTDMGADFWLVDNDAGMASIAARVQDQYEYETFTVRYSRSSGAATEHQKRMRQLASSYELPTWTIQAYVEPVLESVQNVAACRTDRLFEYIKSKGEPSVDWPLKPSNESEMFYAVPWDEIDRTTDLRVYDRDRADTLSGDISPQSNLADWDGGADQ